VTAFDDFILATLAISGLVGMIRGATREITTVVALLVAATGSVFALRFSGPIAAHMIKTAWLANAAAILAVFILLYVVLRLIGGAITRGVRQTSLSGLDRLVGAGIGLARALVVVGGVTLLVDTVTPADRMPGWISGAKLYPLAAAAGGALRAVGPEGLGLARNVGPTLAGAALSSPEEQPMASGRPRAAGSQLHRKSPPDPIEEDPR
jgi:membrane protein required for colicin V production